MKIRLLEMTPVRDFIYEILQYNEALFSINFFSGNKPAASIRKSSIIRRKLFQQCHDIVKNTIESSQLQVVLLNGYYETLSVRYKAK